MLKTFNFRLYFFIVIFVLDFSFFYVELSFLLHYLIITIRTQAVKY